MAPNIKHKRLDLVDAPTPLSLVGSARFSSSVVVALLWLSRLSFKDRGAEVRF